MTLLNVVPLHEGRTGDLDAKGQVEYEKILLCISDGNDTQFSIVQQLALPYYQPYGPDPRAALINVKADAAGDESAQLWKTRLHYSSKYDDQQDPNPLNRPVRWSSDQTEKSVIAIKDNKGKAILNWSGDPYDPPAEGQDGDQTVVAVRNEAAIPWTIMRQFKRSVNSDTWNGCPPRTIRLKGVTTGDLKYEGGVQFFEVKYTFAFKDDLWDLSLLELGYNGLRAGPVKVPFETDHPLLLLKNGDGTITYTMDPTKASYTGWRWYREVAYAKLNLTAPPGIFA